MGEEAAAEALIDIVRAAYLERRTCTVLARWRDASSRFYFHDGEIYLPRTHPEAAALQLALVRAYDAPRPAADPGLKSCAEALVSGFGSSADTGRCRAGVQSANDEMVGPLPAVAVATALAVHGRTQRELYAWLGGGEAEYQASTATPAMEQLPSLQPEMARMLSTLEKPMTVANLLRGLGFDRRLTLAALAQLFAIGLVSRCEKQEEEEEQPGQGRVNERLLASFRQRIADDLQARPLDLQINTHRGRVAALFGQLGELDHYRLLGLEVRAVQDEVLAAYNELARVVHPAHAARLGLVGKEEMLTLLFERATDAYLTLSDPRRRASYNTLAGIRLKVEVDRDQRQEEKEQMAQQSYLRAMHHMGVMDYSQVIDLLKEAVRMAPQAKYFFLLGQAQSKNPNWHRHALESFRRAIELDAENAGLQVAYAELLEKMGQNDQARAAYEAALQLMPDHPEALAGRERLNVMGQAAERLTSGIHKIFRRRGG